MCRLLGIVAEHPTTLRDCLRQTPRSLAWLSREHAHGWGVALCAGEGVWRVHKNAARCGVDPRLDDIATLELAQIWIAHVRERTVGRVCLANTHPFRRDRWVFAHIGTIADRQFVKGRMSARRAHEIEGDTDSELLFSYLLSCLDIAGANAYLAESTDAALTFAVLAIREQAPDGSFTFLMSDGRRLYAYRRGSPLFVLQRRLAPGCLPPAPPAVLVAERPITEEAWQPLPEGALLRVDRLPVPNPRLLVRGSEASLPHGSGPGLPFTD